MLPTPMPQVIIQSLLKMAAERIKWAQEARSTPKQGQEAKDAIKCLEEALRLIEMKRGKKPQG